MLQPVLTRLDRQEEKEKKKQRSKFLVRGTCPGKQNCSDRTGREVTGENLQVQEGGTWRRWRNLW